MISLVKRRAVVVVSIVDNTSLVQVRWAVHIAERRGDAVMLLLPFLKKRMWLRPYKEPAS